MISKWRFWGALGAYLVFVWRQNGVNPTLWEQWSAPPAAPPVTASATIGGVTVSAVVDPVAIKALAQSQLLQGTPGGVVN